MPRRKPSKVAVWSAPIIGLALLLGLPGRSAEAAAAPAEAGETARYLSLEPVVISVIRQGRPLKQISITIVLHVVGEEDIEKVKRLQLRLVDAYRGELHRLLSVPYPGGHVRFDAGRAKQILDQRTDAILGEGTVREILFTRILEQQG
ncbi:MAG: hypothetical protein RIC93_08850 [Alphaproteobacteria bacterium]